MQLGPAAMTPSWGLALVILVPAAWVDAAGSASALGNRRVLAGSRLRSTVRQKIRRGMHQLEPPPDGDSGDADDGAEVEVEVEVEDDALPDARPAASEQESLALGAVPNSNEKFEAKGKLVRLAGEEVREEFNDTERIQDAEEVQPKSELERAKSVLQDLKHRRGGLETRLANFSDDPAFEKKLQADMEVVASQTNSAGLAKFLGDLRKDVRTVAGASYSQHLEAEIAELKVKEDNLMKEISGRRTTDGASPERRRMSHEAHAAGLVYSVAMFSTVLVLAVVFGMLHSSNALLSNCTWFALDQVIAVFVAVMWFRCFDGLLDYSVGTGLAGALTSVAHAAVVLAVAVALAYVLRRQEVGSAILCGCGAHYVSFASMHAAAEVQQNVWLAWSSSLLGAVVGFGALLLFIVLLGLTFCYVRRVTRLDTDDALMDRTENLENDFGGMAAAFVFALLVRYGISGYHPSGGAASSFEHTALQRNLMLCYGVVSIALAVIGFVFLSRVRAFSESYSFQRVAKFVSAFLVMNVAWAWILWGEWEFYEGPYTDSPALFGEICCALAFTVVAAGMIFCMAYFRVSSAAKIAIFAVSLVVAWSWEATFDTAVDHINGAMPPVHVKLVAALVLSAVVLPVYALHFKPITMKAAEGID